MVPAAIWLAIAGLAVAAGIADRVRPSGRAASVGFRKHVLDSRYRAEGVAVADVNRDGKLDIMAGDLWYEAPDWKPHEIVPPMTLDPASDKSDCYLCFADDLN